MHAQVLNELQHQHDFVFINHHGERRTRQVFVLTLFTMALEIGAGWYYGSMALFADGWHMATHGAAFIIALLSYRYARQHAHDNTFVFGAGKVGVLGGFSSAMILFMVALIMLVESGQRLLQPHAIQFDEAILIAEIGFVVNLLCALLLKDSHHHHHEGQHHHDHNLKAAYLHVLADSLTSLLAIGALVLGKFYDLLWCDAVIGAVGGGIILRWAYQLLRETSAVLLDKHDDDHYVLAIRQTLEADADNRVADLHLWRVAPQQFALIVSLVSHNPQSPAHYKKLLNPFKQLKHVTVEVHICSGEGCHD